VSRDRLLPNTAELREAIAEAMIARKVEGYRDLDRRSDGLVSYQTAREVLTGRRRQIRERTIVAIAETLDLDSEALISLSVGEAQPGPWTLGEFFDRVPAGARPGIERGLRLIVIALESDTDERLFRMQWDLDLTDDEPGPRASGSHIEVSPPDPQ
jgi:hypothetical protein